MLRNSLTLADLARVDRLAEAREMIARWQAFKRGERVQVPNRLPMLRDEAPPTPPPPAGQPWNPGWA